MGLDWDFEILDNRSVSRDCGFVLGEEDFFLGWWDIFGCGVGVEVVGRGCEGAGALFLG